MARTKGSKNKSEKLSAQQEKFCRAWVTSFNFQESMRVAGYTESYIRATYAENFITPKIQKRIDELLDCEETITIATPQEILMRLTRMMRREETDQVVIKNEDGSQSVVDVKVSCKEAIKACELLGKRYQLFTDKIEASMDVSGQVTFVDDMKDEDEIIYIEDQDYVINDDGSKTPIDSKLLEGDKDE